LLATVVRFVMLFIFPESEQHRSPEEVTKGVEISEKSPEIGSKDRMESEVTPKAFVNPRTVQSVSPAGTFVTFSCEM